MKKEKLIRFIINIIIPLFYYMPHASAGQFTLPELEKIMLKENPKLKAMEIESEMIKKKSRSAGALDDPKLKLGVNNLPLKHPNFRDEDMTSKEIGISQMLPLGGKISARKAIVMHEYEQSRERLRREKIEMITILRKNVYELCYVRESINIIKEIKNQVRLLIDSEIAANKSGMGSLTGVIKYNLEYSMLEEEIISLTQRGMELQKFISYLTGKDLEVNTAGSLDGAFVEISSDKIKEEIISSNPDLAIIRLENSKSAEEKSLREREYIPDIDLGFSYMQRDPGPMGKRDDMFSGMASFNIPLWFPFKNMPMVDELKKKQEMTRQLSDDKRNELMFKAETQMSNMKKWEELYKLYNGQLIPQSSLALDASLARFKTGAVEFMSVVDTIRMLLRYKKDALMAKKEYLSAFADLRALTGSGIEQ